jgi:quercetin dioxygenase-like cupin family protein
MNQFAQGQTVVIGPEEGESFWQPIPSTGFITSKITPYNSPYDSFSSGIQVLEPGCSVRQHAHERSHELIFIYEGEGYAEVDGQNYELRQGSMMVVGRGTQHMVFNSGKGQLKMMWVIFPPGLEDWFQAIGKPRIPGDAAPEPFERPKNVAAIQDQQRFVRPKN